MSTGRLFLLLAGVLLCCGLFRECADDAARELDYERSHLVDTIVYIDTIRYYQPVPRDSAVIRYITKTLPIAPVSDTPDHCDPAGGRISTDTLSTHAETVTTGSALVTLPIISRHYTDSAYEAWVSGPVDPRLDSLRVFPCREEVRIRETSHRSDHNGVRWGIGVFAGWGVTPHGMEPCAGISVNYNLWIF